ncbi:hypothetical protein LINPERHAP2_LOCUS7190 [Linum perenne]
MQSHPKASGLNNKPLLYYDDLSVIFGVQQAIGAHAVQPGDAASKIMHHSGTANYMEEDTVEHVDSYTIPSNMDHNAVMEDLMNQGNVAVRRQTLYAELAKFPELTGNQRTRVLRHLNHDDGNATTFFQLPTDEEKLEFIWWILE